jgi:hypothetical protein
VVRFSLFQSWVFAPPAVTPAPVLAKEVAR